MKNVACSGIAIVLFLGLTGLPAGSQSQSTTTTQNSSSGTSSGTSLGAYARQVRKDPGTASKPKVFDNDNLPKDDKLSVVGQTSATAPMNSAGAKPANSDEAAPAAGENKSSNDAKPPEDKTASANKPAPLTADKAPAPEDAAAKQAGAKQWSDKLTAQKDQIDLLTRELDVLQREYQIRAAAMYADAGNRMRNSADWDKQDTKYKQDIADKQKALEEAKQKQDDLQEEARKSGVPASVREP